MCKLQLLAAHAGGVLFSVVTRFEAPAKNVTVEIRVGTNIEEESTMMSRAGTALLAMLLWKRKEGEESKDDHCTEEGHGDQQDNQQAAYPIMRAKPRNVVVPKRKTSIWYPGAPDKYRVNPTADWVVAGTAGH